MNKDNICKALLLPSICATITLLLAPDFSKAEDLNVNKFTNLKIKYSCEDSSQCTNLEDIKLILNNKTYKAEFVENITANFRVPVGKTDYEIVVDNSHKADNMRGIIHISDAGDTVIEINSKPVSNDLEIIVDGLIRDIDGSISNVDMQSYNTKGKLISDSTKDIIDYEINNGKASIKNVKHGKYTLEIPSINNMKELREDIVFSGDSIQLHSEHAETKVTFKIDKLDNTTSSGVVANLKNLQTGKIRELNFADNGDTYLSLPLGEYELTIQNYGIFDNTNYVKKFTVSEGTEEVILELVRKLSNLHIRVQSSNRKPVPNAEFDITSSEGYSKTAKTNSEGILNIDNLSVGNYTVTQLNAGDYNVNIAEPVSIYLSEDSTQSLDITNTLLTKVKVNFIPMVGDKEVVENVTVRIKGLSETNKFIDNEIITNGNNPTSLDLNAGLYSIQLQSTGALHPIEHTRLMKLNIDENSTKSMNCDIEYTTLSASPVSRSIPVTGNTSANGNPIFAGVLSLITSALLIYRYKK